MAFFFYDEKCDEMCPAPCILQGHPESFEASHVSSWSLSFARPMAVPLPKDGKARHPDLRVLHSITWATTTLVTITWVCRKLSSSDSFVSTDSMG